MARWTKKKSTKPAPLDAATNKWAFDKIVDRTEEDGGLYYKIRWKGFSSKDDTWEPRHELMQDVPEDVEAFDQECEGEPVEEDDGDSNSAPKDTTSEADSAANMDTGIAMDEADSADTTMNPGDAASGDSPKGSEKQNVGDEMEDADSADVAIDGTANTVVATGDDDSHGEVEPTCDEPLKEGFEHGGLVRVCEHRIHGTPCHETPYHVCETCHDEAGITYTEEETFTLRAMAHALSSARSMQPEFSKS